MRKPTHRYYSATTPTGQIVEYYLPRKGKLTGHDAMRWAHLVQLAGDYRNVIAADQPGSVRAA